MYDSRRASEATSMFAAPKRPRSVPEPDSAKDFAAFEKIAAERERHMKKWKEVYRLMMPDRLAFEDGKKKPGEHQREPVDAHAGFALERGAGNLMAALFPPERRWVELVAGAEIPEAQADQVNESLEKYRDRLFDYIGRSNFYSEAHTMLLDLMCSTGALLVERGTPDEPLRHKAVPLSEVYPIADASGNIVGVMRCYDCEAGYIEAEFSGPGVKVNLPDSLRAKIARDPKEKVKLLEVSRRLPTGHQRLTVYLHESKQVIVDHVGSDPDEPSRWIVSRLMRLSGEVYGRGRALTALPTVKLLNLVEETEARAMRKRLDPPLFVDSRSDLNPSNVLLSPAAVNVYNGLELGGGAPVLPLQDSGTGAQYSQVKAAELREQIDTILFARSVLPPVQDSHAMTAAEVMVRRQEMLKDQGVDFGRFNREFLFGYVERAMWVLKSFAIIPPMLKVDGKVFKIRYSGPLAQAMDADDATNVLAYITDVTAAVGPEAAMDGIRIEDVPALVGDKRNVPRSILRTEAEREQRAQQKAQIMAAQAAMQAQGAQA